MRHTRSSSSPEWPEAPHYIEALRREGVVVSIGHTQATSEQIAAAVQAGATMSTHLGNGAPMFIRRHPNYIWAQLADDRLWASLICDGHHLPPYVVKTLVRAKTPARCLLASDAVAQAGLAPGRYRGGLGEVEMLRDGRLVVAGQTELMAGATELVGTSARATVPVVRISPTSKTKARRLLLETAVMGRVLPLAVVKRLALSA